MYSRILKLPPRSRAGNFSKSPGHSPERSFSRCYVIRGDGGGGKLYSQILKLPWWGIKHEIAHLGGGMDCVTASYARVAGSSPTEKEQKVVPFSFIHNPPYLYLMDSTPNSKDPETLPLPCEVRIHNGVLGFRIIQDPFPPFPLENWKNSNFFFYIEALGLGKI